MNRENPIHIVRDIVLGMEGESADAMDSSIVVDSDIQFADEDLSADFDAAMEQASPSGVDDILIEQVDKDTATNLVPSALHPDADFR